MIIIKLQGGLGNQLFQYALGRHLAIKHNTDLLLDTSAFQENNRNPNHTPREYELNKFAISAHSATATDIESIESSKKWNDFLKPYYKRSVVRERRSFFNPHILSVPDNSLLVGYWQTEKYFNDIAPIIRKDFTFWKKLEGDYFDLLQNRIVSTNSVSIHFRRGDYIANPIARSFHGVCPLEYYYQAVDRISKQVENPSFFVFSDDIEWAKANFEIIHPVFFVERSNEENHSDFRLMSLCKHNIIANSSYSWWAAWLNDNPDKSVIAPSRWFADPQKQGKSQDLIPESWQKI